MRVRDEAMIFPLPTCALAAFTPQKCPTLWEKWCRGCNLVYCKDHVDPKKHNCRSLHLQPGEPIVVPKIAPPPTVSPTACGYCHKTDNPEDTVTRDLDCEACGGHHRICKRECLKRETKVFGSFPKFKTKLKRCPPK